MDLNQRQDLNELRYFSVKELYKKLIYVLELQRYENKIIIF